MTEREDMVERVARALFDAENIWRDMQQGLQGEQLCERHFKVAISEYRMKARAAISAMQEPTEAMLLEAHHAAADGLDHAGVWHTMIDAALEPP